MAAAITTTTVSTFLRHPPPKKTVWNRMAHFFGNLVDDARRYERKTFASQMSAKDV